MLEIPATLPARFLRTPEAARFLGVSCRTLERHRTFGTGPRYRKLGGRIVYKIAELQAWADQGLRRSTTDPDGGFIPLPKAPAQGRWP
ncbi:helix-turn-helix domain-containing protein [Nguyenibacter vanlangensis]|uniref:Helix-turn-helix domain-containing protein n=1 Tax=Nguyenibacter vanlangensis TaxID=1216886 RepID=A0ABZ3DAR3_9PROT